MVEKKLIFFAYKGQQKDSADDNVTAIYKAVEMYNIHQKKYEAKLWEDYKRTTSISKEILEAIDKSPVFICDMTYFNHNVLFELGYAIGCNKQILILVNNNIGNSGKEYTNSFLRDIRYTPFSNSNDILNALNNKYYQSGLIEKYAKIENLDQSSNDIFYIISKYQSDASLGLTEIINELKQEKKFTLISYDPLQIKYKPMEWFFQNIIKSKNIIIHLLGENIQDYIRENAKNSFFAGLACGIKRKVILFAPAKYKAPLDYNEILIQYKNSDELQSSVIEWIHNEIKIDRKSLIKDTDDKEERELNLLKLGIGCEYAEGESDKLNEYFVETASYNAAMQQEKSIITGRMGSGKSAIYLKLSNDLSSEKNNYVISLRPESDEILEDVEKSIIFKSEASKRSFFLSVWKLVIFSKLINTIYEKIKYEQSYDLSDINSEIITFTEANKTLVRKSVFGIIREISYRSSGKIDTEKPEALYELYRQYLSPLIKILKKYFTSKNYKYYKIIILADGLDQTWDLRYNLELQTELITALLNMENKIKDEFIDSRGQTLALKQVIFLRKDIFEYILEKISEAHKIKLMEHEVDWEKYPKLLKTVIDNRFKFVLSISSDTKIEKLWQDCFTFSTTKHPYEIINNIILCRPRDIIYFVSRLFESAVNEGHSKVEKIDLEYAIKSYLSFLNDDLKEEL
ncbi:MAG: hypothetical protein JW983_07770, partial [Elusimicrobia bacterium]|nr:hypothetical protein [Elusimicrobiota bacterium]